MHMSGWSIGRVFGIPIRLHWSLLALGALVGITQGQGALGVLVAAALLFASIVAHELAHALTARLYGIETRDIVLTPIGGIARLEGLPATGRAEVAIALAGPIMSLAIAGSALAAQSVLAPAGLLGWTLGTLASSNAMLGLFNLVPAFPLDGGRVLRGFLHERIGLTRATDVAASVGRFAAIVMGFVGLLSANVSLVLIAMFVWVASGRERSAIEQNRTAARPLEAWDARGRAIEAELMPAWPRRQPVVVTWRGR
jgi:Zn-dependent protease